MKSALKIFLVFFVLVLIAGGISLFWTYQKLIPSLDRDITLEGLRNEVSVQWNHFQVPYISAVHESDIYRVMGYLHARDRLWQMTKYQYKLEGLHSQEIDESLLEMDRFYLSLSFGEIARASYQEASGDVQQLLEAYAAGVNQYVEENRKYLPVEFALSNARPVNWEPWHSIGILLLWSWDYQQSFWSKLAFHRLHMLGNETLTNALTGLDLPHETLFGTNAPATDSIGYVNLLNDFLSATRHVYPTQVGKTGTGFALSRQTPGALSVLFSTRESPMNFPDTGYEVVLSQGGRLRAGVTIPGLPVMLTGQNDRIAWSIHPLPADDGDFFTGELFQTDVQEPVNWIRDPGIYDKLADGLTIRRRILTLKSGAEYEMVLPEADNLPVVAMSEQNNRYLAFQWAGFESSPDIGPYIALSTAGSPAEAEQAVRDIQTPSVQVLISAADGYSGRLIGGMTLARDHPLKIRNLEERQESIRASDLFPGEGNRVGAPVFFYEDDPARVTPETYTTLFLPPWRRSERFMQLFGNTSHESLFTEIPQTWINDTYSPFAATLTPVLIRTLEQVSENQIDELILTYLQNWNYEYHTNETAATLFELFMIFSAKRLYGEFLGQPETDKLLAVPHLSYSAVTRMLQEPARWPAEHSLDVTEWIQKSMTDVRNHLTGHLGEETHAWQWEHTFEVPVVPTLFEPTLQASTAARLAQNNLFKTDHVNVRGAPHTIRASHINAAVPQYLETLTTSFFALFPEPQTGYYSVTSSGQSSSIFSDHNTDQFTLWNNGEIKHNPLTQEFDAVYEQYFRP